MPYKPHDSSKSPMTDFQWDDIQADVLATDVSTNSKISSLKQLKTETKIPTKAINALAEQLENAQASASDAVQRVSAVTGGIDLSQLAADVEALKAAIQANQQSEEGQSNVTSRLAAAETRMTNLENAVTNLNDAPVVYKNVKHFDDYTKNGEAMDVVDHTFIVANGDEVQASLPDAVSNVTFSNAQPEDSVNVYFDSDELAEINSTIPGDYPVNLTFEHGYGSTFYAPSVIVHVNGVNTQASHIYGMVLVETNTNGGNGTWIRINRDFEEIEFSDEHGTWKNINIIDDPTYGKFVEFPITWVRSEVLDHGPYNGKTCYWTADGFVDGFHIHPAFIGADGNPHPLQIAAYMASNKNDIPFSQDKNNNYENYWYNRTYKDWNELKWVDNQLRLYTIYDHHFLARLMLTEFGTPDVQHVTVNGIYWGGANRIDYHGVIDPMGLLTRTGPVPCCYALFGIAVNDDTKTYKVMANDGSLQLVETNMNVFTSGDTINYPSAYINTCYVTTSNGVDFGDMFIMETGFGASNSVGVKATDAKGSFGGDTQGNGIITDSYIGTRGAPLTWSNNGSKYEYGFMHGMFSLMGCSETGTRVMVRTCRCS